MSLYNGDFVSHEPEEESYLFFAEDQAYDYYCRIYKRELEKLVVKLIMGNRVEKVVLNKPTTISIGPPAWARGKPIYHQLALHNCTFIVTTTSSAPFTGTYDMQWHVRIVHDQ